MAVGNVAGLSSGIEWNETVDQLMQIERQPVNLLEGRRANYKFQLTNWELIETRLSALQASSEKMDEASEFLLKSTSSNDETVLKVDANNQAIAGSHDVIINQLATNHVIIHGKGWADADNTAVNDSGSTQSFSYTYGAETVTTEVPDGTTLNGLVYLINNQEDNPGVTVSILNDGKVGSNSFHLVVSGKHTGENNSVSIVNTVDNPTNIGRGRQFGTHHWSVARTAQNSEIRVDGYPGTDLGWPNPWIESDSNEVEDIIPGLTLNLLDSSDGDSIRIDISIDNDAIKENVNAFIATYNSLLSELETLSKYDSETKTAGPLFGDSLVRRIKNELMDRIGNNIPGTVEGDEYRNLGQIGVTLSNGGLLTFDSEAFDDALENDAPGVTRLFVFDGTSSSSFVRVAEHDENTVGGVYDFTFSYDADGRLISENTNTIGGVDGILHGDEVIEGAEGSDVEGLLVEFTNPGDGPGSISGSIRLYTGISALFQSAIDEFVNTENGDLANTQNRIFDTIDLMDSKIENLEKRLENVRSNYERKFLSMEILIGQLQNQGNYLDSVL